MARYVGTVNSPRPIEEVFAYMADFSNASEWDPASVESNPVSGGAPSVGSRYEVLSRFLGREVPLTYEIVEMDPPRLVVLRAESDAVVSLDRLSFGKLPAGGTELTYDADLQLKGWRKVLDPAFGIAFRRLCERARTRMQQVLS